MPISGLLGIFYNFAFMKYIYLLTLALLFSVSSNAQIQIGEDIIGEAISDGSGRSVSLSSDGNIVAIGAPYNSANGQWAGHVKIYQNISGVWTQIGDDIDGEEMGDLSGISVSLSSDGSVVAIGATGNDGKGISNAGHVRIYEYKSGVWTQLGDDIDGEADGDESGSSVSLSADGSIVAIMAPRNIGDEGNTQDAGHVRIYQNLSGVWTQLGDDINGEEGYIEERKGSVSLSSDGSIVAIGDELNSGNGRWSGHVRIYEYKSGAWTQLGDDIDGEFPMDQSGWSVSLSSDGSIVAIGAKWNAANGNSSGHVRIYQNISGVWTQLGDDIDGEYFEMSGYSIALSSDGSNVAVGYYGNSKSYRNVRIYQNISGVWTQIGDDINGERLVEVFSVSLSSDGSILAIGSYPVRSEKKGAGLVRIYGLCNLKSISQQPINVIGAIGKSARMIIKSNHNYYQWQSDNGGGFFDLVDTGQFKGSQTDTLTIRNLKISDNNTSYRCVLGTLSCRDTSEVAVLKVENNLRVNEIQNSIAIYPNPTSNKLNISVTSRLIGSRYRIFDPLGKQVLEGILDKSELIIDVSHFVKGAYLFQTGTENYSHSFMVE